MARMSKNERLEVMAKIEAWAGKKSAAEIGRLLGRTEGSVRALAQSEGISLLLPGPITEHDKQLMRELKAGKMPLKLIAEKFSDPEEGIIVTPEQVGKICRCVVTRASSKRAA